MDWNARQQTGLINPKVAFDGGAPLKNGRKTALSELPDLEFAQAQRRKNVKMFSSRPVRVSTNDQRALDAEPIHARLCHPARVREIGSGAAHRESS